MKTATTPSEADILAQIVAPGVATLSTGIAREFLNFKFDRKTTQKIRRLLAKNNRGTITAEERVALDKYLRVGQFLDLVHAKARLSLQAREAR